MTKTIKNLISILTCVFVICTALTVPVWGYTEFFFDDMEADLDSSPYDIGSREIGEAGGNRYSVLYSPDSRYAMMNSASKYPTGKFIISVDFMIPEGGATSGQLLSSAWYNGKGNGMHIWLNGRDIGMGNNGNIDSGARIVEGLQENRWYNIFALIDTTGENPKYTTYIADNVASNKSFITSAANVEEGSRFVGRYYFSSNMSEEPYYIDNVSITTVDNQELDIALHQAKSKALWAEIGYENGMYPESAKEVLLDSYEEIKAAIKNRTLAEEEVADYLSQVNTAVATFESRKIDTADTSTGVSYVRINESGSMTTTGGVMPGIGYTATLDATAYTKSGSPSAEAVTWSVEPNVPEITITGNTMTVAAGYEGDIVLKASCGSIYNTFRMKLLEIRDVAIDSIVSNAGEIKVTGSLSNFVEGDVNIAVAGDDNDPLTADIVVSGSATPDSDNKFTWSTPIDSGTPYQKIAVTVSGGGIVNKTAETYYYGDGWEDGVLSEVNNATSATLLDILNGHSKALNINAELLNSNKDNYCARILDNVSYTSIEAMTPVIAEIEYVLKHGNVTRSTIETLLAENIAILKNNGFDLAKVFALDETIRNSFYANAAIAEVDMRNDSIADICIELNTIYTSLLSTSEGAGGGSVSTPSGGSSGGGGGGGGGGLSSFPITLVDNKKPVDDEETTPAEDVKPVVPSFSDVKESDWFAPAMNFMKEKGIMTGYENSVRPNDAVTRGELAKIVVTAFGLTSDKTGTSFSDGSGAWWNSFAETAAACGVVNGLGDGRFGGDEIINREMLAVMIDRAITAKNIELYDQNSGTSFNDESYISDYAKAAIERLSKKGIIKGVGEGVFAPSLSVTRAEAAQIVYNVLKQL